MIVLTRFITLKVNHDWKWLVYCQVNRFFFFQKWFARHLSNEPHHRVNNTSIQSFVCPSFSPWTSWNVAAPPPRSGVTFFSRAHVSTFSLNFLCTNEARKVFSKDWIKILKNSNLAHYRAFVCISIFAPKIKKL